MKKTTQLTKPLAEKIFRFLIGTSALPHFWQINDAEEYLSTEVFIIVALSQLMMPNAK